MEKLKKAKYVTYSIKITGGDQILENTNPFKKKLFVKNTKLMIRLQIKTFCRVKLANLSIFGTFRIVKNRFDYLFEHNLNLFFSI
jgi:hypothetical protein